MKKEEKQARFDMIDDLVRNIKYERAEIRRLQEELRRDGVKSCPSCRRTKEDTEFGANAGHRDGLATYCKECRKARKELGMSA